jgi:hypothetical protein
VIQKDIEITAERLNSRNQYFISGVGIFGSIGSFFYGMGLFIVGVKFLAFS